MLDKIRAFVAREPVLVGATFSLIIVLLTRLIPDDEIVANVLAVIGAALGIGVPAVVARSKVTPEKKAQARIRAAVEGVPPAQL